MSERVLRIRRRLEGHTFPTEVSRRLDKEGLVPYFRTLWRALGARDEEIRRQINTNAFVPTIEVDTDDGPAFAANWQDAGSHQPLRFWKTPWDDVHLVGLFDRSPRTPASPETIFTLPEGFRPAEPLRFAAVEYTATPAFHRIDVETNGDVEWNGAVSYTAGLSLHATWRAIP